ncbi:MAG: SPFH domain-containing protein [Gemmataceae bacterium]
MESNEYLNKVVEDQERFEQEVRGWRAKSPAPAMMAAASPVQAMLRRTGSRPPDDPAGQAVDYRITGWWRWKTVVVPPNVYVVHTRRGRPEPVTLGLGVSFRYNPTSDAFLVIPAAVQTLLINARCISIERQGVLVQAYVQWVVDDLRTAYRRLDFSDRADPMRVVNVQLREQAEAAIKDKVATMPIDAILSDKQPIIEELTLRLRSVAESSGEGAGATGLGLKIVTVQIKEAVVSSTRLWENLQKPFRSEREKLARLAELETTQEVTSRERANRQEAERADLESARQLAELRAREECAAYDRNQAEKTRRHRVEQEAEQAGLAERAATERARRLSEDDLATQLHELEIRRLARDQDLLDRQLALEKARTELERYRAGFSIERENLDHQARAAREERDVEVLRQRRAVENDLSEMHLRARLIERLPEIASAMPKPEELKAITIQGDGSAALTGLVVQLLGVIEGVARSGSGADLAGRGKG